MWGELVTAAAYVHNRRWSRAVNGIPYTKWHGSTSNIESMVPVGPAWIHLDVKGQDKLDPRAIEGYVVGYQDSHTYRVLLKGDVVITARNVRRRQAPGLQPPAVDEKLDDGQAYYDDMGNYVRITTPARAGEPAPKPIVSLPRPEAQSGQDVFSSTAPQAEGEHIEAIQHHQLEARPTRATKSSRKDRSQTPSPSSKGGSSSTTAEKTQSPRTSPSKSTQPQAPAATLGSSQLPPAPASVPALQQEEEPTSSSELSDQGEMTHSRSSSRIVQQPLRYGYSSYLVTVREGTDLHTQILAPEYAFLVLNTNASADSKDPVTYQEAIDGPDGPEWQAARDEELGNLLKRNTYVWATLPPDRKANTNRWVWRTKRDYAGEIARRRARVVARGFSQIEGLEFTKVHSPVSRHTSLRCFVALSVQRRLHIYHFDVETAYLYGDLDAEVYMEPPLGLKGPPGKVLLLKKSIYGLKQSGRMWHKKLVETLTELGFVKSFAERCLFERTRDGEYVGLLVYVDDLLAAAPSVEIINKVYAELSNYFAMKNLGPLSFYLGIRFDYDYERGVCKLSQQSYIQSILTRFGLTDVAECKTPMAENRPKEDNPDAKDQPKLDVLFAQAIGCLLYISLATRPDITFAVQQLAQHTHRVTNSAWRAVKRIFRYLKATQSCGITYSAQEGEQSSRFEGWCDAGETETPGYCVSGYVFTLAGGPVSWATKKQTKASRSSQQAELHAAYAATSEAMWLIKFRQLAMCDKKLLPQPRGFHAPLPIHIDSKGAIAYIEGRGDHELTKHYRKELLWLQEALGESKELEVRDVRSEQQRADILTKALGDQAHRAKTAIMGVS